MQWLRRRAGDDAVRDWIRRHRGRSLSRRQLRFWQLILDLPARRWMPGWRNGAGRVGAAVGGVKVPSGGPRGAAAPGPRWDRPSLTARGFRLGGGTGLALLLGYHMSEDFDWFSTEPMADPMRLAREIQEEGVARRVQQVARGTIHGTVDGVRLSLFST